jgi:hypothetical protein
VLEAAGSQVASLQHDQVALQVAQLGEDRLYVTRLGPDFDAWQDSGVTNEGQQAFELVAYEVGTWRVVARRSWHQPIVLEVGSGTAP